MGSPLATNSAPNPQSAAILALAPASLCEFVKQQASRIADLRSTRYSPKFTTPASTKKQLYFEELTSDRVIFKSLAGRQDLEPL